ncbi:MAG: hypothetical protein E6Q52_04425 [Methylophilus sp.]|nr:MAG: hypothetical protein E6Q52_04425 [Methylophilus sp.]
MSFDGRPTSRVAQGTSGSWGVLFFAFFLMDKHKKEWSPKGRNRSFHKPGLLQAKKSNSPKGRKATSPKCTKKPKNYLLNRIHNNPPTLNTRNAQFPHHT